MSDQKSILGAWQNIVPGSHSEERFNCCTKFYPDGAGGWYPVKRVTFNGLVYNPSKLERRKRKDFPLDPTDDLQIPVTKDSGEFWQKSYNRARQQCFDYMMCTPDLDTFLTFTVDPSRIDTRNYDEIVKYLSQWLDNRVRRKGLKYILVPELHRSGAYHFHGVANFEGLKLIPSGYFKYKGYTLAKDRLSSKEIALAQEIYNVADLPMGFSTAIRIEGESAQTKVSKYLWKYMTKQQGQKIGGRFYLHGGDLQVPKLVYSHEFYMEADGVEVVYGSTACKIETFTI